MPSAYSHHSTCKQIVRLHSAGALPLLGHTAGSLRQEPEPIIVAHHCASFEHTADFARSPAIGVGIRSCTNRERYGVASHTFMKRYACALGFVLPVSPRLSSHLVVRTPAAHLVGWMYAAAASTALLELRHTACCRRSADSASHLAGRRASFSARLAV